jgi:AraC-like DNA-binding protein/mannose-6-phosphate isomerase-like protein (cupin superfamily)
VGRSDSALDPSRVWRYGRRSDGVEQAIWSGDFSLPLACHFHSEIQITTVLIGRRRFVTANGPVTVNAGETLIVPPGLPHQALGIENDRTLSLNLYLRHCADTPRKDAIVVATPRWFGAGMMADDLALGDWTTTALRRAAEGGFERAAEAMASVPPGDHQNIGDVASARGMSREGFIRWFHRNAGMTPHAYRVVRRLNRARALLATGAAPAAAAAEAGFADQSHMGRHFRLAFGATPAAYRGAVHR